MPQVILEFLKKNWIYFALAAAVSIYLHIRLSNAEKIIELAAETSKAQITAIQDAHKKELEMRDKSLQEYQDKVKSLEEDYRKKSADLAAERKKKIQVIVKYYDNPEKLISQIQGRYGFEYVPVQKTNSTSGN